MGHLVECRNVEWKKKKRAAKKMEIMKKPGPDGVKPYWKI